MRQEVRDMTEGRSLPLILAVALPLMFGNIFQQLYTLVDASVVGKGIGLTALAALGSADWFNWMFLSLAVGFTQGFTIPVAQAFGAKDYPELRRYVGSGVVLSALVAVVITAFAEIMIRPVLALMGTQPAVLPMAVMYLRILFGGIPVVMAYNLLAGILRALGDSKSPLYAMIVSSFVNIALDLLFVLVFHWGVAGAAIATVIAQGCSCIFCFLRLRKVTFLRLAAEDFRMDSGRMGKLFRLGLPISLQNAIIAIGGMIVQSVVNQNGVIFVAGYTATNKLYGLLEIAAVSYGYAMSTYTGQNLGAGKYDRIWKGVHVGAAAGIVTALAITVLMITCGTFFIGLFIEDSENAAEAMRYAYEFLRLMALFLPVLYVLYVYRSAEQGMGNTLLPMLSGILEFFMRTGAALLLPALIGYQGLFWAEILAWIGADLALIPGYYLFFQKVKKEGERVRSA